MAEGRPGPKTRVVLRPEVTLDEVEEAALDLDWLLVRNWPASDKRPYEDIYLDRDEQTAIHYLDDHLVGLRYLVINGPDAGEVEREAREALPTYQPEHATAAWAAASTPEQKINAVNVLALATDPAERDGAVEALQSAAADLDREVRRAVILATTYVGWPELRALLSSMEHDADESVRQDARWALEGLAEQDRLGG